ncbi:MAG: sulfite exporter TauE/SafE family protein [Burkholderiales bacterium]|nr:sulfite exporter TauE/SafE family protein [Burkholderiales bacterium]
MDAQFATWTLPLTALTTGFLGSVHCLGMCGGISATVALASPTTFPQPARDRHTTTIPIAIALTTAPAFPGSATSASRYATETNVLAFNAGRIASYALAGAMAGTLGGALADVGQAWVISGTMPMRLALFVLANLMIMFTGLYLMGLPQLLAPLERAGGHLWKHLAPWSRRFLPLRSPAHAAMFGALWGWIPCGMVYAMLLTAMSAGSAVNGAMTMLAFGVGTLPAMVGAGWSAGRLRGWTRNPRVRLVAGLAVLAMGIFGLSRLGTLEQLQSFGAFCTSLIATASNGSTAP